MQWVLAKDVPRSVELHPTHLSANDVQWCTNVAPATTAGAMVPPPSVDALTYARMRGVATHLSQTVPVRDKRALQKLIRSQTVRAATFFPTFGVHAVEVAASCVVSAPPAPSS